MMLPRLLIGLFFLPIPGLLYCQGEQTAPDAVLTYQAFMNLVRQYHPAALGAELLVEEGNATVMGTRGQFDPRLSASSKDKNFGDQTYYNLIDAGLLIPTATGIDISAGYEQTSGVYLNPERTLPEKGQMALGVTIPALHQLIINERKLEMQRARLMQQASLIERRVLLNKLLFDAAIAYWKWSGSWQKLRVYDEAVSAARQRLLATKESAELGDIATIDTVEARTQVQQFEIEQLDALLKYQELTLKVSNFLWDPNGQPLRLDFGAQPEDVPVSDDASLPALAGILPEIEGLSAWHPELLLTLNKQSQLEAERRIKLGKTLPKIKVDMVLLADPTDLQPTISDYRLGAGVQYPIFTRRERADLNLTDLKLRQVALDLQFKQQKQENDILTAWYKASNTFRQIGGFRNQTNNFLTLLEGEQEKFFLGQSSLFLVNAREVKYIKSRLDFIDAIFKFEQAKEQLRFELFSRGEGVITPNAQ